MLKRLVLISVCCTVLLGFTVSPAHAATLTVNSNGYSLSTNSVCTLPEAIAEANRTGGSATYPECGVANTSGVDTIVFSGPLNITSTSSLVFITSPIIIDATPHQTAGDRLGVRLSGSGNQTVGLWLTDGASGSEIRGLSIVNFTDHGLYITTGGILIEDNYFGTDKDLSMGLGIGNGTAGDVEGAITIVNVENEGTVTVRDNLIVESRKGIYITGSNNFTITDNDIGTPDNFMLIGYGVTYDGIAVYSTPTGGTNFILSNLIGDSGSDGIFVNNTSAPTTISFNVIGADTRAGDIPLGNQGQGIHMVNASNQTLSYNTIVANDDRGIWVRETGSTVVTGNSINNNYIGTNAGGEPDLGNNVGIQYDGSSTGDPGGSNTITSNMIYYNTSSGLLIGTIGGNEVNAGSNNCFIGNGNYSIVNASLTTLYAPYNYYGTYDGPGGDGSGSGNPIYEWVSPITEAPHLIDPPAFCEALVQNASLEFSLSDWNEIVSGGLDGRRMHFSIPEGTYGYVFSGNGATEILRQDIILWGSSGDSYQLRFHVAGQNIPSGGVIGGRITLRDGTTNRGQANCVVSNRGSFAWTIVTCTATATGDFDTARLELGWQNVPSGLLGFDAVYITYIP